MLLIHVQEEDCGANGPACAYYEWNPDRNSGHKNVLLGKNVWRTHKESSRVSALWIKKNGESFTVEQTKLK